MGLTPLQKRVWTLRKARGLGYSEVGRRLGLDRSNVYTIEKRTAKRLREASAAVGDAIRLRRAAGQLLPLEACSSCGSTRDLVAHPLRLNPKVIVTLCRRCHRLALDDEPNRSVLEALRSRDAP